MYWISVAIIHFIIRNIQNTNNVLTFGTDKNQHLYIYHKQKYTIHTCINEQVTVIVLLKVLLYFSLKTERIFKCANIFTIEQF